MGAYIQEAKDKLFDIVEVARERWKVNLRVSFVGYRDHCDKDRFEVFDFVHGDDGLAGLRDKIGACRASGGGDTPEDVAGALQHANQMSWESRTRLCVHIADAPCHGKQYHDVDDSYPDGDPHGLVAEDLLAELGNKRVNYYCPSPPGVF